jgi:cysteine desulfurase
MVYLDNAATTKAAPEVVEAMLPWMGAANPSSLHSEGGAAHDAVHAARAKIAASIGASPDEIVFTSGGTEANNLAIKGVAFAKKERHIVTTAIEHKCVLNACRWLEAQGWKVTYLPVDKEGYVDPAAIERAISPETILVSVIHGHNEIGTIQDIGAIGALCRKRCILFHTDACQSYTKVPIDMKSMSIDLMTINAHKIHGPKGVGALYVRRGVTLTPLLHGGDQERRRRPGTENVAGIVGFGVASQLTTKDDLARMARLRDRLIDGVLTIQGVRLNGPRTRLCNNANFSFRGVEGEAIVGRLDAAGIQCSTGSACSEASLEPSYVLKAIGCSDEEANGSLRMTLSRYTTDEEIDRTIATLPTIIKELRAISPVGR